MSHTACRLTHASFQGLRAFVPGVTPTKSGPTQAKHLLSKCPPPLPSDVLQRCLSVPDLCVANTEGTSALVQRIARQRERCLNSVLLLAYNGDMYYYYIALALQRPMHVHLLALSRRESLPLGLLSGLGQFECLEDANYIFDFVLADIAEGSLLEAADIETMSILTNCVLLEGNIIASANVP
eukprot:6476212-Amphidinium_carterae.1